MKMISAYGVNDRGEQIWDSSGMFPVIKTHEVPAWIEAARKAAIAQGAVRVLIDIAE